MKTFDPEDTPKIFLMALGSMALSFIPVLGWFLGLWGVVVLVLLFFADPGGFFGMLWRLILVVTLLASVLVFLMAGNSGGLYRNQCTLVGTIGFILAACGLARSFYLAHIRNNS
jgi:hypothetical protein